MFDLGWSELMFVAVIAVLILGPKELPKAMRTMAKWVRKARLLASDFQRHVDDVVRESELEDLRKEANKVAGKDLGREIDQAVDPDGSIARSLEFDDKIDPTGPAPSASTKAAEPAKTEKTAEAKTDETTPASSPERREGSA